MLPGGSGATHYFFRRGSGGPSPAGALTPRGMHAHGAEFGAKHAQIGWNIEPLPARQHDIAGKHSQIPIFPAATFDNISGTDGETLGQGGRLAINWRTHGSLLVCVRISKFEHRQRGGGSVFSLTAP